MSIKKTTMAEQFVLRLGVGLSLAATLGGCVPLVLGGAAVGTALVVSDRRTSGSQLEDEGIEVRASNRVAEVVGDSGHVAVTSYNRTVLLTGEVPSAQARQRVGDVTARVDNVQNVVNEVVVDVPASIGQRSNDTYITGRVKAALVDTRNIQARAIKVVTERAVVYLMGLTTQREADIAAEVARNVGGVQKVVRVFQIVTEAELARAQETGAPTSLRSTNPAPIVTAPTSDPLSPARTLGGPASLPSTTLTAPVQTMPVR